jgi:predicted nucleotidyltransferase
MQALRKPQLNLLSLTERIQPQPRETQKAKLHLMSIRRRLTRSFDVNKFLLIGSHYRDTAVRWYSDVDFMVVLRRNEAKWGGDIVHSSTVLNRIRDDLNDRFTYTDVRRDQQAVVVSFSQGNHSLDVVPAIFARIDKLHAIYWIPDGANGWMETSPTAHNGYFAKANKRSGGKLAKTVQLLKWWKFSRVQPIPIESFHLDSLLAASDICIGVKSYAQCLYEAFKLLTERECRGIRDPLGIAGIVDAARTDAQWNDLNVAVQSALIHSRAAMVAEAAVDFEESNRQWSIVFNGEY